ncbi:hypothetical protein Ndes2526B_g08176 [Nannochloris sp. 'desiccata']
MSGAVADEKARKSKEDSLAACVETHRTLVACFKSCSFLSSFTGCCIQEHKTFWDCYTTQRGTNETKLNSWLKTNSKPSNMNTDGDDK